MNQASALCRKRIYMRQEHEAYLIQHLSTWITNIPHPSQCYSEKILQNKGLHSKYDKHITAKALQHAITGRKNG